MVSLKNRPSRNSRRHSEKFPEYRFVVSACLAGIDCTFKGKSNLSGRVRRLFKNGSALAACPEVAGGLGTPRERSEICGGGGLEVLMGNAKVLSRSGEDKTVSYIRGAARIAGIVKHLGIKKAILKSDSPACGSGRIHDGTFSGRFRMSDGVFAAMLKRDGIRLYNEKTRKYE